MINLLKMGTVTSSFGARRSPTSGASTNHKGIDIVLDSDVVPSVLTGTVSYVGYSETGGNMIYIEQEDGTTAKYMHLSTLPQLRVGELVEQGTPIGDQGSTGVSTGKHLHFQVEKDGKAIDPEKYFSEYGSITAAVKNNTSDLVSNIAGKAIQIVSVILVFVFAVYLFMKAFEINII